MATLEVVLRSDGSSVVLPRFPEVEVIETPKRSRSMIQLNNGGVVLSTIPLLCDEQRANLPWVVLP
jgi:hypothetical protein